MSKIDLPIHTPTSEVGEQRGMKFIDSICPFVLSRAAWRHN